jgi:hypothetical protein
MRRSVRGAGTVARVVAQFEKTELVHGARGDADPLKMIF